MVILIVVAVWLAGLALFVAMRLRATRPGSSTAEAACKAPVPRRSHPYRPHLHTLGDPRQRAGAIRPAPARAGALGRR